MSKKNLIQNTRSLVEKGIGLNITTSRSAAQLESVRENVCPIAFENQPSGITAQPPRPTLKTQPSVIPHRTSYEREKCDARREWVESYTNSKLKFVSNWWGTETKTEVLKGNIEMPIGTITMPLGIAGPIAINGEHAKGEFLLPAATTEGALVASINRGAAALNKSGEVYACAGQQRMTRCPVFKTKSALEAYRVGEWIKSQKDVLQQEVVSKHSRHAQLKDIFTIYDADICHAMFVFETGDAAGQNACTSCTWHALVWMRQNMPKDFEIERSHLDGNLSGDKKGNNFNCVIGRGTSVMAKTTIPEAVLNKVLKITSQQLYDYWGIIHRIGERTNQGGGNANISNVLAAVFAATGQDIACVNESSFARTTVDINEGPGRGVHAQIFLPSMIIGTVGGGTNLPTQAECLDIMGCRGAGKAKKYAEIIATYCLALDLSTASAMATDSFATAHDALGRNRPNQK